MRPILRVHHGKLRRQVSALSGAVVLLATSGCVAPLASLIASAPNRICLLPADRNPLPPIETLSGIDDHFWVDVGPPEARLSVSVIEPRRRGLVKGTILVTHGVYARSFWMLGFARQLADAGYRAVLVDLRGHGRSSGRWLTYGVQEAQDLSQVIDVLERRGLARGQVGVLGMSYGATAAIHLAAVDPRVGAVVSVAPFSTMRQVVPRYLRIMLVGGCLLPEKTFEAAIDEAGRIARFDPDLASAVEAVQQTRAQVLIVHGTTDLLVPCWHAVRVRDAAPDRVRLALIPGVGHVVIWADPRGEVIGRAVRWFDRWLWVGGESGGGRVFVEHSGAKTGLSPSAGQL